MRRPTFRTVTVGALAATAIAAPAASAASAEPRLLGLPVPDLGQIITQIGGSLGSTVPGGSQVVTDTTGGVGGIVTGTTGSLGATIDAILNDVLAGTTLGQILGPSAGGGGDAGGLLPSDALEALLASLGIPVQKGTPGTTGDVVVVDARAPDVTFRVLTTKLRNTGKDGRIKLQVTSDEPGVVALSSTIRPGLATPAKKAKKGAKAAAKAKTKPHSRKVIHVPTVTLGFRKAGSLKITVRLSKAAQATLARSRDARISVGLVAADTAKNQVATRVKKTVKR